MPTLSSSRCALGLTWLVVLSWVVVTALAGGAFASGPPVLPAYTSDGNTLVAIDLLTGDTDDVGPYGLADSRIESLAFFVDGRLLGVDDLSNRLVEIDLLSGMASVVGPLGIDVSRGVGMAVDACGDVWLSARDGADNVLAQLDPVTGAAHVLWTGYPSRFGLAADGSRLLAAIGPSVEGGDPELYEVDRSTGELQLIASLNPASIIDSHPSLDFDDGGELWGLSFFTSLPPPPPVGVYTVDLESGTLGSLVPLAGTPYIGLAITPPGGICTQPVVDVPALGAFGGTLLALVLILASCAKLRQRRMSA